METLEKVISRLDRKGKGMDWLDIYKKAFELKSKDDLVEMILEDAFGAGQEYDILEMRGLLTPEVEAMVKEIYGEDWKD